jgi:hypothetical protein
MGQRHNPRVATSSIPLEDHAAFPRMLSRGRAFVYVVACRDDNLFKIGFSRDPLHRWRTLHPRFFEFFDLDRGVLVTTDRVNEARRLERRLLETFADYQSFAPLTVPLSAAGHSEWFRGAMADAVDIAMTAASSNAWKCQRPDEWMRSALLARQDLLFAWTATMLEALEFEKHNAVGADARTGAACERALVDTLDAYRSVRLDVSTRVPAHVLHWYAQRR